MTDNAYSLRRYLLGELSEPEMERLEIQLMTSEERFQELLIAEDELVDEFCAGSLNAEDAERYRRVFSRRAIDVTSNDSVTR